MGETEILTQRTQRAARSFLAQGIYFPRESSRLAGLYGEILNRRPHLYSPRTTRSAPPPHVKSPSSFSASVLRRLDRRVGKDSALHTGIQRCEFELPGWEFIIKNIKESTLYEEENSGFLVTESIRGEEVLLGD